MNRRGEEEYLSIWNVVIWVVLGGTVALGMVMLAGESADVHPIEAAFLTEKIADCVTQNNELNQALLKTPEIVSEQCDIASTMLTQTGPLVVRIQVTQNGTQIFDVTKGNTAWLLQCSPAPDTAGCATTVRMLEDTKITITAGSYMKGESTK